LGGETRETTLLFSYIKRCTIISEKIHPSELIQTSDKPSPATLKQFLEAFHEGIKCYQERKWDEGIASMEHAMGFKANDPVCQIYIERMKLFQIHPPEKDWNGVFVLATK
jgi:adenylate cyclase